MQNTVNTRTSTHFTKTHTQLSKLPHIHTHLHTIVKTPTHTHTPTHNCQNSPTYTHPHITKQVKTTTVQDTHQMLRDIIEIN